MIIGLPHHTFTEYHRDFFFGALEKMCSGDCPVCGGRVKHIELRLRKILGLPIFRGKCSGACKKSFTFLPRFACPGKWYGYFAIERALLFVSRATSPNAAFQIWEANRELLAASGTSLGPSTSTVSRWWDELGQSRPDQPWLDRALGAEARTSRQGWPGPAPSYGPDGLVGEKTFLLGRKKAFPRNSEPKTPSCRSSKFSSLMLSLLLALGEALLGSHSSTAPITLLGTGLWLLEPPFQQRCLARANLVGRIIPGSFPEVTVNSGTPFSYPPEPSPPP